MRHSAYPAVQRRSAPRDHGADRHREPSMKIAVTDPALLGAVRPLDLSAYLRAHGWRPLPAKPEDELADWEKDTDVGRVEVSVPRHSRWRDYPRRVREIVAEVAGEDWDRAVEAMRQRAVVRYRGELVREGRSYMLRNPRTPPDSGGETR